MTIWGFRSDKFWRSLLFGKKIWTVDPELPNMHKICVREEYLGRPLTAFILFSRLFHQNADKFALP